MAFDLGKEDALLGELGRETSPDMEDVDTDGVNYRGGCSKWDTLTVIPEEDNHVGMVFEGGVELFLGGEGGQPALGDILQTGGAPAERGIGGTPEGYRNSSTLGSKSFISRGLLLGRGATGRALRPCSSLAESRRIKPISRSASFEAYTVSGEGEWRDRALEWFLLFCGSFEASCGSFRRVF